jgi:hypothetical protein
MSKNSSQSIPPQSYPFISSAKSTLSDASQELENIIACMFYPPTTGGAGAAAPITAEKAYLQKYRTEICKFWEQTGTCQYGDTVSISRDIIALVFFRSRIILTNREDRCTR